MLERKKKNTNKLTKVTATHTHAHLAHTLVSPCKQEQVQPTVIIIWELVEKGGARGKATGFKINFKTGKQFANAVRELSIVVEKLH